ncbi:MAG: hypothetical protein MJ240_03180 [Kiritimatiellae bacterium]|nr:hypothetical protein [Kiritimatiellia bacterium]
MKTLMFTTALIASAGVIFAQNVGVNAKTDEKPTTIVEQIEEAGDSDEGPEIVVEATQKEEEIAKTEKSQPQGKEKFVSAEQQVQDTIEKKMKLEFGYISERKSIIAQGTSYATVRDPANDETFMALRTAKATEAYLLAKIAVIQAISTDFTAFDRVSTTAKYGESNVEKVFAQKQAAFAAKRAEFEKKLAQLDSAEAEALEGVTLNDRFGAILDGIAKKINSEYDPEKISADKKAKYEALKAECEVLRAEFEALQEDAEKIPATPKNEVESGVTMLAKMPLIGSSVLTQAESWDESTKQYSVSMAIVWSPKLQDCAVKIAAGNYEPGKDLGTLTRTEWMNMQDLAAMVGPRRFVDKNGHPYFVGIAATDLTCQNSDINGRKMMADAEARKAVAFSLVGDLKANEEYKMHLKEYQSKSDDLRSIVQNLVSAMDQKADLKLQGCLSMRNRTLTHPITGRKTYVTVFYVDPSLSKDAAEILKSSYAASEIITKATQYNRGVHAGLESQLKATRESKAEFKRGKADGQKQLQEETKAMETRVLPKPMKKAVSAGAAGSGETKKVSGKSRGGSYSGDAAIDTNF